MEGHHSHTGRSDCLLWLGRSARRQGVQDCDMLSIGDSMAELLSFERGRSRDHGFDALCRQAICLQIALKCRWRQRYVLKDRNAPDHNSNLADRGLLPPGQILSGRRLISQLAAPGAHEDVLRFRHHQPVLLSQSCLWPFAHRVLPMFLSSLPHQVWILPFSQSSTIREAGITQRQRVHRGLGPRRHPLLNQ